ncbi:carboxypeptidase N subunit 2-like [Anopheles nili]|uniref:carboxypeptidase N subunit 2-like n=1 Tax=Anopheles nili TaxID=185578 RepID=UPI00237C05EA|nr:carboxypeptidase N subunit 2-like [Anopheles nili]
MVKLWVVFVLVAIVLPKDSYSQRLRCIMEPDRSCSLLGAKVNPDEIMSTVFITRNASTLTTVQFKRSSLTAIPPGMFQDFPKLETLNASFCDVKQVLANNFGDAKTLQQLLLRGNKIHDLPEEAFFGANRLQLLDLSDNAITIIESTAFKRLRDLKTLLLARNQLTELPLSLFEDLSELETLELQQNNLGAIDDQQFQECHSLSKLNVSHNALKSFDLMQFERRWSFDIIDVSHNHLASVQVPSNLRQLVATGNGIRTVEGIGVDAELILLKMPHNKLASVDNLPPFEKLISLDVSYNRIREFDFRSVACFTRLILLKLDGNQLETVSSSLTDAIPQLKYVHLADNHLTRLDLDMLWLVPRMLKLDLHGNRLEQIDATNLSASFPQLVRIMLEGNRFRCEANQPLLKQLESSNTAYAMNRADCSKNETLVDGLCCS